MKDPFEAALEDQESPPQSPTVAASDDDEAPPPSTMLIDPDEVAPPPSQQQQQQEEEDEDEEEEDEETASAVVAGPAKMKASLAKGKGKGKVKEVEEDQEEEEEDVKVQAKVSGGRGGAAGDADKMGKMQEILSKFTEEQMSRYESFRRSGFQKSNMKKLLASIIGSQKISVPMTIVVSGIAKLFVGELVETSRTVMMERKETGPVRPCHIREAYRRLKLEGKIPRRSVPRLFR